MMIQIGVGYMISLVVTNVTEYLDKSKRRGDLHGSDLVGRDQTRH